MNAQEQVGTQRVCAGILDVGATAQSVCATFAMTQLARRVAGRFDAELALR